MSHATQEVSNEQLFQEFNAVVAETEQLLKSVAGAGSDKAGALRASVEQGLADAGERLARIREASIRQAADVAHAADEYVHGNPWQAIGIGTAVGAFAGLVAGLMISRR